MGKPTEMVLMARAARRYYLEDRSKTEIADELGISRFRVARLIDSARRDGLVRIEIESPSGIDVDLSAQLQAAYGLRHSVVVDHPTDDAATLRARLGAVAAEVLNETVTADDVLGLAWARSVRGIGNALTSFAPCRIVQLTGALSGPDGSDVLELVRSVARAGGGPAHVFYAPLVAPDAVTARTLRRQPDVARAVGLIADVTVAVVGIGAWAPGLSTIYDMLEPAARDRAAAQGVIGDVSGVLIDAAGRPAASMLSRRFIGMTGEDLAAIPSVMGIAYGEAKAQAVRAAITGGMVDGLVTHTGLARRLLAAGPTDLDGANDDTGDRGAGSRAS